MATVIHCFIVYNSCVDTYTLWERVGMRGFKLPKLFRAHLLG